MVLWKVYGEGCRRQHNGLPRLRFAQVVAKTQVIATRLFVGLSDDGRVVVPVLVLFFVFVIIIIIIIVGISRRYRVAADDGDEAPDVVRDAWSHDRVLRRRVVDLDDVSARV